MNAYEKLKAALIKADKLLSIATFDKVVNMDEAERIKAEVKDAIRTARRNCDVGTAEEQAKRFNEFCEYSQTDEEYCSMHGKCVLKGESNCTLTWAQMPYEEEDNNADE